MNEKFKLTESYKRLVDELYNVTEALTRTKKLSLLYPNDNDIKVFVADLENRYIAAKENLNNYKVITNEN